MYANREIYPLSPLQLVVAEVRYPFSPRLKQPEVCDAIQLALEHVLPVRRNQQLIELEITPEGRKQKTTEVFRLVDRASFNSALIGPERTVIETTHYNEFAEFLLLITEVLETVTAHRAIPAIERLGLRYIDEVRPSGDINAASEWGEWIAADLIAPTVVTDDMGAVANFQGLLRYSTGDNMGMIFRYAVADGPGVIGPDSVLRSRQETEPGPFFLLDIDSYWQASTPDQALDADVKQVGSIYTALHCPTGVRFQSSLTEKARQLFRGVGS